MLIKTNGSIIAVFYVGNKAGAIMKNGSKRYSFSPHGRSRLRRLVVSVAMIVLMQNISSAQDIIVNGTMTNTGTIKVKNQAIIAQPSVGGEIILTGADQTLPAKNYQNVQLNGTGTKTTSGGNLSVSGNLTIAAPVTLKITKGNVVTLGDTLFEFGILRGAIQKSVNLSGGTTTSNFGNIGATISWSSNAPGVTNVLRASDSVQIGNGNESIKRYYKVSPADTTAVGDVLFKFTDAELNGHDISSIELWHSIDNGNSWRRRPAVVDAFNRTISKTNVPLAGMWAIADTLRPLGPLTAAGVPAYVTTLSAPPPDDTIFAQLQPYVVLVTDAFGDPIRNAQVSFAVTSAPVSASGYTLSDTLVVTDSLGRAQTRLTLGNKIGSYVVTATSPSLNPVVITAKAKHGAPSLLAMVSGNNQQDTIYTDVSSSFVVSLNDAGGNPVDSTLILFAITASPQNAAGQQLSSDSVFTDSLGRAAARLTLGNKPGTYIVTATSSSLSPIQFSVVAVKNTPASIASVSGNNQEDTILTQVQSPFIVVVNDSRGNPVDSAAVTFAIATIPSGATGQQLSVVNTVTDSLGRASTILTLGSRTGLYVVHATVNGVAGAPIQFSANAVAGAPSQILLSLGNNQTAPVGTQLPEPFTVAVVDAGNNPVQNDTVNFAIASTPDGAVGQRLSATTTLTSASGQASSFLTLGNKTGEYTVAVRSTKLPGVLIFRATSVPSAASAITVVNGNNQSAQINTIVQNNLVVVVRDTANNVVPSAAVTFAVTGKPSGAVGDSLGASSVITDTNGVAATSFRIGNKVGVYEITASVNTGGALEAFALNNKKERSNRTTRMNTVEVKFFITATHGAAASLAVASGNNQTAQVGTALQNAFAVHVVDAGANNVPNANVTFSIVSAPSNATGQSLSATVVQTDSLGIARTTLTLGNKTGEYKVSAAINGIPSVEFSAFARPGAPTTLAALGGTAQTKQILTPLNAPFVVRVFDASGNAVPQAQVSFAITSTPQGATGMALSDSIQFTDSLGQVSVTMTLGNKVGLYGVTAAISGIDTVQFTVNATHGAAALFANLAGQNQTKPTEAALDTAFTLSVRDIGDNPVPGVPVRFAVVSTPPNAVGYALSDTLMITDSLGNAFTYLQLGDWHGTYIVEASTQGVPQAFFSATGYLIYGDVNKDFAVNIGDMTTIIDFFNGRKALSAVDSLKADFNGDGIITRADLDSIRETILGRSIQTVQVNTSLAKKKPFTKNTKQTNSTESSVAFADASMLLETTPLGLRVNLLNAVPVRGMELRIKLNDSTVNVNTSNLSTKRGRAMDLFIKTVDEEVRVLMYNLSNTQVSPDLDTSSLFRLPDIYALSAIDTSHAILALENNTAVAADVFKEVARPGKYPATFSLRQNYPNPFNSTTTIEFDIADGMRGHKVVLQIFNVLGQHVKTLVSGEQEPGHYVVKWDGRNEAGVSVASGVYFYRFLSKDHGGSKKMILLK